MVLALILFVYVLVPLLIKFIVLCVLCVFCILCSVPSCYINCSNKLLYLGICKCSARAQSIFLTVFIYVFMYYVCFWAKICDDEDDDDDDDDEDDDEDDDDNDEVGLRGDISVALFLFWCRHAMQYWMVLIRSAWNMPSSSLAFSVRFSSATTLKLSTSQDLSSMPFVSLYLFVLQY